MKLRFAEATKAPAPRTKDTRKVAWLYAFLLVVMATAQLFGFEEFIPLIESFWLPGGHGTATLVACLLVVTEVFALPFLLGMRLSPVMRVVSMVCGWVAAAGWLKLSLWANLTVNALSTIGFLGTSVTLPVGWWAVFFSLALVLLATWASWGMWPLQKATKHAKK